MLQNITNFVNSINVLFKYFEFSEKNYFVLMHYEILQLFLLTIATPTKKRKVTFKLRLEEDLNDIADIYKGDYYIVF